MPDNADHRGPARSADHLSIHFNKPAADAIILLSVLVLPLSYLANGGGGAELCATPPDGNPNLCHIYTWTNFPLDHRAVPPTGMFGNDSSYVFALNITGIIQFQICTNIINFGSGNATLTLQYQATLAGLPWLNVDTSGGQQGSVILPIGQQNTGDPTCSNNVSGSNIMGNFNQSLVSDNCVSPNQFCNFRIAGNQGICTSGCNTPSSDQIIFSNILIQFWFNGIHNQGVITCTAISIGAASATNKCATSTATSSPQTVTVLWEADNRSGLGAGCGVSDTCVKKGSSNCILVAAINACTSTDTYGQTFTGTVRVSESWNVIQTLPSSTPFVVSVIA